MDERGESPQSRHLALLAEQFRNGCLEVIVGAGASQASGMPSWDELSRRVLAYFLEQHESHGLTDSERMKLADVFVHKFGRDAALDLVRTCAPSPAEFQRFLRDALYAGGPHDLRSIHFELAAIVVAAVAAGKGPPGLVTFNYDNLLERAIRQLLRTDVAAITSGERPHSAHVLHLHGYLPPPGSGVQQGNLILSERDYLGDSDGWATRRLTDLADEPSRTLLLVGLSLTDPRLKRLLFRRTERIRDRKPVAPVYVLLSRILPPPEADLLERIGNAAAARHAPKYWESWELNVVWAESHALVPHYLRQIRLGMAMTDWARAGLEVIAQGKNYKPLYTPETQDKIRMLLDAGATLLKRHFQVPEGEELHIGAFVPSSDGNSIQMAFHRRDSSTPEQDVVSEASAASRRLDITNFERPQGAAGLAYLRGITVEAYRSNSNMDANFTPKMRAEWVATFASLVCVPVYDSPQWAPVGVAYLNSNKRHPFWKDLTPTEYLEFEDFLRRLFRTALQYRSVLD